MRRGGQAGRTASTIPLPALTRAQDALLRATFVELMDTSAAVPVQRLADLTGLPLDDLTHELGMLVRGGRVETDGHGRLIGALGLTVGITRHELVIGTGRWHTWCVIDALGILGALAASGSIRSTVPGTNQPVEVTFTDGRPDPAVHVAVFVPDYVTGTPMIENWCPAVNFFPDVAAADAWADAVQISGHAVTLEVAAAAASTRWRARLER